MKRALVVGRSLGAMDEYRAARELCAYDFVVVVGKMGEVFPDPIDYWVSFHTNLLDKWAATRAANGHPPAAHCWGALYKGRRLGEGATRCAPISWVPSVGGSSGLVAVQGALDVLGADRVVLAGMPMAAEAQHYPGASSSHELGAPWSEADKYWVTWEECMGKLLGGGARGASARVRSMSGRTRDVLGCPDAGWLGHGS